MTLQVAEQMAPGSCRSGTEKRVALRKARPLATLNPSKPAGPLSKGTLSLGGCFFSTPAGPLSKGMLSYGGYFFSSCSFRSRKLGFAQHTRRASAAKHAKFGGFFVLPDPLQVEAIASELDELPTPYQFDIVALSTVQSASLRDHIARAGVRIYG